MKALKENKNTVYVVNNGGHDFSAAERFGRIVYLSDGLMNKYSINVMYRMFSAKLRNSRPTDYILCTSLTQMNMVAAGIFSVLHGRLNVLIYKDNDYVARTVDYSGLRQQTTSDEEVLFELYGNQESHKE